VPTLINQIEDANCSLPKSALSIFKVLISTLKSLDDNIAALDGEISRRSKEDPAARRLMTIPGVGPVTATAIVALAPSAETFKSGRDFAAWLGLTPLQKSTGGNRGSARHQRWESER
jgi:transposase